MNKQIDEIAKLICTYPQCIHYNIIGGCENTECSTVDIAEQLYKAGYHRQDEVAREIFTQLEEEIEAALKSNYRARAEHLNKYPENYSLEIVSNIHGKINTLRGIQDFIEELKKKYEVPNDEQSTTESNI